MEAIDVVPHRQLDQGTYEVHAPTGGGGTPPLVGYVYVEGTGDLRVEHWALFPQFSSPSGPNRMDVKETGGTSYTSFTAFCTAMHALEPTVGTLKYVRATCEYFTQLP